MKREGGGVEREGGREKERERGGKEGTINTAINITPYIPPVPYGAPPSSRIDAIVNSSTSTLLRWEVCIQYTSGY